MILQKKGRLSILCAGAVVFGMLLANACPVVAQEVDALPQESEQISDLGNRYKELEAQKRAAQAKVNEVKSEKDKKVAVKQQLEGQIGMTTEQISVLLERISLLEESIEQKEQEMIEKQDEIDASYELFKKRVRAMSKLSGGTSVGLVLGADTYSQFVNRSEITARVAQYDKALMAELASQKAELADIISRVEQDKKEVETDKSDLSDKKQELDQKVSEAKSEIQDISLLEQQFLADQAKYTREMRKVQADIDKIYADIARRSTEAIYVGGAMGHPTPSLMQISSAYGPRFGGSDYHTGVDFYGTGAYGKPILAANDGTVAVANYKTSGNDYGIYVIIDHGGGITTQYAHCSALSVAVGEKVKRGQQIASVGMTGWATGPHLHFEVRVNGKHQDPMPYITGK